VLISTLPMTDAFGATNTAAASFGRWSNRFMTARCLQSFSWKIQLSCADRAGGCEGELR
jgi:hypothetical protein